MASGKQSAGQHEPAHVVDDDTKSPLPLLPPPASRLRPVPDSSLPRFPADASECLYIGLSLRTFLRAK